VVESLEAAIAAAYAKARARWPDVVVELARFAAEIVRRLGSDVDAEKLAAHATDDLYLAIACLDGNRAAIEILERDYFSVIDFAARKVRATVDQANEIRGHLRQLLFTAEPTRAAALAEFTGRGDLRGYLKTIATRELIRAVNRGRKEEPIDPLLEQLDVSLAPELAMLRARHGETISDAIRAAIDALEERPRSLLRYSLVHGWSIDRIGELYDVNRSTAARWLNLAREALGDQIRTEAATRLNMPIEDIDSIVRQVQSQIDVSLLRIL
jgi:RNA polymerase sigma-70 factor (ECF subfamily)